MFHLHPVKLSDGSLEVDGIIRKTVATSMTGDNKVLWVLEERHETNKEEN